MCPNRWGQCGFKFPWIREIPAQLVDLWKTHRLLEKHR